MTKKSSKRLTYPKYKHYLIQGMSPKNVLEKVFKKYKGTIHDTSYWKNQIKRNINMYYKKTIRPRKRSKSLRKRKSSFRH